METGTSDPVSAAYAALVEDMARVYAAAGKYLRGMMGLEPRRTQTAIAQEFGYSRRQVQRAVRELREVMDAKQASRRDSVLSPRLALAG